MAFTQFSATHLKIPIMLACQEAKSAHLLQQSITNDHVTDCCYLLAWQGAVVHL
jgi:hypothetical protein